MTREEFITLLKSGLQLKMESRCDGHMAPTEAWLVVMFDNESIAEVKIGSDEYWEDGWKVTLG